MASCGRRAVRVPLPTGQQPQTFAANHSTALNSQYLLYLPKNVNQRGKLWPLILYLHGSSLRGDNIERLKAYGLPHRLATDGDFPFIVVSPQCPAGRSWDDAEALNALLDEVVRRFPVDTSRIYLSGISLGGNGAWFLGSRHPERFAAIAPLCGPAQTTWACSLKEVPVRVYHGAKDTTVPLQRSEAMVKTLKECGGDVELIVLPKAGHDLSRIYEEDELYDWFLKHRKK